MTILIALVLMLLGFVALYFGAEWLVEGAVTMATHLRISKVVAGLILVALVQVHQNCLLTALRQSAARMVPVLHFPTSLVATWLTY